jgi:hypothetical protein
LIKNALIATIVLLALLLLGHLTVHPAYFAGQVTAGQAMAEEIGAV